MSGDKQVPAYLYEQLMDELLLDPEELSAEIIDGLEELRLLAEPTTQSMPTTLPRPPVRKEVTP